MITPMPGHLETWGLLTASGSCWSQLQLLVMETTSQSLTWVNSSSSSSWLVSRVCNVCKSIQLLFSWYHGLRFIVTRNNGNCWQPAQIQWIIQGGLWIWNNSMVHSLRWNNNLFVLTQEFPPCKAPTTIIEWLPLILVMFYVDIKLSWQLLWYQGIRKIEIKSQSSKWW